MSKLGRRLVSQRFQPRDAVAGLEPERAALSERPDRRGTRKPKPRTKLRLKATLLPIPHEFSGQTLTVNLGQTAILSDANKATFASRPWLTFAPTRAASTMLTFSGLRTCLKRANMKWHNSKQHGLIATITVPLHDPKAVENAWRRTLARSPKWPHTVRRRSKFAGGGVTGCASRAT